MNEGHFLQHTEREGVLKLENVSTGYPGRTLSHTLNLQLPGGCMVGLLGPNGAGKSTLFKAIAFGTTLSGGTISIQGHSIKHLTPQQRARLISVVMGYEQVDAFITVEEFVSLGRTPYIGSLGHLRPQDRMIVRDALHNCDLKGYEKRVVTTLSDGEKQRALIARALVQETPIVLLDEPTSHLDLNYRTELFLLLQELSHTTGRTFLLSTHEIHMAIQWCDRLWLMDKNSNVVEGIPEELAMQGAISHIFDNEKIHFDACSGRIEVDGKLRRPIQLLGNDPQLKEWTARMLTRLGYAPQQQDAYACIQIEPGIWILREGEHTETFTNMSQLQERLWVGSRSLQLSRN